MKDTTMTTSWKRFLDKLKGLLNLNKGELVTT